MEQQIFEESQIPRISELSLQGSQTVRLSLPADRAPCSRCQRRLVQQLKRFGPQAIRRESESFRREKGEALPENSIEVLK